MRLLISGVCGFVGSTLAEGFIKHGGFQVTGIDNFVRPGSEVNRVRLGELGVKVLHGDLRAASDLETLPKVDWVIDAAANPSVLAGIDGRTSARQLLEHNLIGTINLLEYCRAQQAGFTLLSTSRVYSIAPLATLAMKVANDAYYPSLLGSVPPGLSTAGLTENFPTLAPISLYGASKLASEVLALEYGDTFSLPVYINRCGVLAGAGQFGRPDQGIFSYWINRHLRRQPLNYLGFGGSGYQVRDCLHPRDLIPLLKLQFARTNPASAERIANISGGVNSAVSLRNLTAWCDQRFGPFEISGDNSPRRFDIPWMVLDSTQAQQRWNWKPTTSNQAIFEEIAEHAVEHPHWLALSSPS